MQKVSVIIPAYNQADFLGLTLQSVLSQTYKDFECIIIDDGSTDNTRGVLDDYHDKRIRYLYQDNKGLASARNTGIKNASGKYLHFLDSDDLIYPYFLERMVEIIDSDNKVDILLCAWELIDEEGKVISGKIGPPEIGNLIEDLILQNLFPVHAAITRRELFENLGSFDEKLSALEDWDLWLRAAIKGFNFRTLDIVGVKYRRHKDAMTLDIKRMLDNSILFKENFYNYNPDYKEYERFTALFQLLNIYLYAEEANDLKNQEKIFLMAAEILENTEYDFTFLKKTYALIRNIDNNKRKLFLLRSIYDKAPKYHKKYWRLKEIKSNLKRFIR